MSNYNPSVLYNSKLPANRYTFLWGNVYAAILGGLALFFIDYLVTSNDSMGLQGRQNTMFLLNLVVGLFMLYAGIQIVKRRLKDLRASEWLLLLMFVPLVNIVFGLYLLFTPGKVANRETEVESSPSTAAH